MAGKEMAAIGLVAVLGVLYWLAQSVQWGTTIWLIVAGLASLPLLGVWIKKLTGG